MHAQFVLLVTSDWLEVQLQMKDVLNFATTMPGAPSVMMDLMKMMPMSSVASLAILIKVTFRKNKPITLVCIIIPYCIVARCYSKTLSLLWSRNWCNSKTVSTLCWH